MVDVNVWRILETVQNLQTVSQHMGNGSTILDSIKQPTPRMAKNLFMLYFHPSALGAPAPDDILFSHSISLLQFTSQKLKYIHY